MLSTALSKTGRPIVLSLSPGAAPLDKVDEMRQYADMWRISDDVWDMWHSDVPYPQGLGDQFPRIAAWAPLIQMGRWPDADMLPFGYLGPHPGYGDARETKLTHDEQRSFFTLWCMFRSPLMWGGNPTKSDAWTVSLLTNPEVLDVDQHSSGKSHGDDDRQNGSLDIEGQSRRKYWRRRLLEPLRRGLQPAGFSADRALLVERLVTNGRKIRGA